MAQPPLTLNQTCAKSPSHAIFYEFLLALGVFTLNYSN
jgi:hypothetical protein